MGATIHEAWTVPPTVEASLDDRAAIRAAVTDYCAGWFQADPGRMARALHPALAKFAVGMDPDRSSSVEVITFDAMIDATARGRGVARVGDGRIDVSILGGSGSIACAEMRADSYVEYILLLRVAEGWRIVSTAWRFADGVGPRVDG